MAWPLASVQDAVQLVMADEPAVMVTSAWKPPDHGLTVRYVAVQAPWAGGVVGGREVGGGLVGGRVVGGTVVGGTVVGGGLVGGWPFGRKWTVTSEYGGTVW